VIMVIKFSKM